MKTITLTDEEEIVALDALEIAASCESYIELNMSHKPLTLAERIRSTPKDTKHTYSPRRWSKRTGFRGWINQGKAGQ